MSLAPNSLHVMTLDARLPRDRRWSLAGVFMHKENAGDFKPCRTHFCPGGDWNQGRLEETTGSIDLEIAEDFSPIYATKLPSTFSWKARCQRGRVRPLHDLHARFYQSRTVGQSMTTSDEGICRPAIMALPDRLVPASRNASVPSRTGQPLSCVFLRAAGLP